MASSRGDASESRKDRMEGRKPINGENIIRINISK
jgi:hypothetical protein